MMKRLLALALILANYPAQAFYQSRDSGYNVSVGVATYTGPGDVVASAVVWYGFRAYSSAVASGGTQKVTNIRRSSDNHTCDLLIATTGGLGNTANCSTGGDNGQTAASFCASTNCWVATTYDQSGGNNCSGSPCDLSQATAANQPQFLQTGCSSGSLPCMQRTVGAAASVSGTAPAQTAPQSFSAVWDLYNAANSDFVCASQTTPNGFNVASGAARVLGSGGGPSGTAANSAWHAVTGVLSGASSFVNVDGTQTTGSTTNRTTSADFYWGGNGALVDMSECGMWAGALTNTQANNLYANQHVYWGF